MKVAVTVLAFCVAALLSLSMVMLYSAGMTKDGTRYLVMQLIWCGLGLVACAVATRVDYHLLRKFAWVIYGIAIVLLGLVLVKVVGHRAGGARRWFDFHGVRFQPSELGKIALIIMLAWYIERYQRLMHTWKHGIAWPCLIIGTVVGLIFVEPDRGTTILMASVSGALLLIAGVRWKYILPPAAIGLAGFALAIAFDPMRMRRIFSWLDLEEHKTGAGFQAYHAMLAIGSGGWTGLGLGNGRQKLGWVPEHHTDFIFSIIGEELGLVATILVVLTFVTMVICGLYISMRAKDTFGFILGCGISFLIGLQAFINIGVVTSALPNKGLPLPFVSYGGSNLLAMLTCIGVMFNIARQARAPEFKPSNPFAPNESAAAQAT
jgi:cell division protein FtsW